MKIEATTTLEDVIEHNRAFELAQKAENESLRALAQSYLDKAEEDYTWVDPLDVKALAEFVVRHTEGAK